MPNLPAARRGDKTGHAALHGAKGGGSAGVAHGVSAGRHEAGSGGSRGARYGAAFAEGRGGVRLDHLARDEASGKKAGEGDEAGPVHTGSPDVLIGGQDKRAARAGVDVAQCPEHRHREIRDGSATVLINNKPAARGSERLKCSGGHILGGCVTVLIGGDSVSSASAEASGNAGAVAAAYLGDAAANRAWNDAARALLGLDGATPAQASAIETSGGGAGARGACTGAALAGSSGTAGPSLGAELG